MTGDGHTFDLGEEKFDFIVASDLINDLWDVQQMLERLQRCSHPGTRVVTNFYSRLWEIPRRIAEALHVARPQLGQNWLTVPDVNNLIYLSGFETIQTRPEILWPIPTPGLDVLANRYLVKMWPWSIFSITHFLVARPAPTPPARPEPRVTVVVPARNEAGNIASIFDRVPEMGGGTELIFVEGNSNDDTYASIEREIARAVPDVDARALSADRQRQRRRRAARIRAGDRRSADDPGCRSDRPSGGSAALLRSVALRARANSSMASAWCIPMEDGAMRFFNLLGNKFFSLAFSWLLSQSIKDTLCGTKVLSRRTTK